MKKEHSEQLQDLLQKSTETGKRMLKTFKNAAQQILNPGETNKGKMITLPNQAPSMRELLQRHAMGINDNVNFSAQYTGDLPDYKGLEPHELNAMIAEQKETVSRLEEQKNQAAVAYRKKQYDDKKENDRKLLQQLLAEQNGTV